MDGRRQFAGHGPVVELVGILGKALQGAGQFGLLEQLAGPVEIPVAQENAFGFGEPREVFIFLQILRVFVSEKEAIARKPDGRSHHLFYR